MMSATMANGYAQASQIAAGATSTLAWHAAFRLGDAVLEVASDCAALIGELGDHYGECEIGLDDRDAKSGARPLCGARSQRHQSRHGALPHTARDTGFRFRARADEASRCGTPPR